MMMIKVAMIPAWIVIFSLMPHQTLGAAVRLLQHPNSALAYGGRHITIGDIDETALGGKSATLKALSKCPIAWHMHSKAGAADLEQWDVPSWGKQYVIKIKSDTLDAYADCLVKTVKHMSNVVGPNYSGTAWHVTLYGEDAKQAQKSFEAYTASSPELLWYAYLLEVSDSPKNGLPGSDYHLTKV